MLRSLKDLENYTVRAMDGDVGHVANFFLDDEHWTIRLVVRQEGPGRTSLGEAHQLGNRKGLRRAISPGNQG
jgi:hypothetical protein